MRERVERIGRGERLLKIGEPVEIAVGIRTQVLRIKDHFPDVTHLVVVGIERKGGEFEEKSSRYD